MNAAPRAARARHAARWVILAVVAALIAGCLDIVPGDEAFAGADVAHPDDTDGSAGGDTAGGDGGDTSGDDDVGSDAADDADDAVGSDAADDADDAVSSDDADDADDTVSSDAADTLATSCVGKKDGALCDDGDPCTTSLCAAGVCTVDQDICSCHKSADCKDDDDDVCTGVPYCDVSKVPSSCKTNPATIVQCSAPKGDPCVQATCDAKTGACAVVAVPDTKPAKLCDDGNGCTVGDHCEQGSCVSGTSTCVCTTNADCANKEDGDLCNGTLFCDISLPKPQCVVNPATVVVCPSDDLGGCATSVCDPKTGTCTAKAAPEKSACSDNNPCTAGDVCLGGVCKPGTDLCLCGKDADCAAFDDGDVCNGGMYCELATGTCKINPKTVVHCPPGQTCAQHVCDPKTGACKIKPTTKFTQCDADGNPCTVDDTCDGKGACVVGTNVCVCESNADCAGKEDGDLCNGTLYCDKLAQPPTCVVDPTTVKTCSKANDGPCLHNQCDFKTGTCAMVKAVELSGCEDGDACTVGDVCQNGACLSSTDLCACKQDADCIDDGDACNGVPYCDTSKAPALCKANPKTVVTCSDGDGSCLVPTCDPSKGSCAPTPSAAACDDDNACTIDVCTSDGGGKASCGHTTVADGTTCGAGKACVAKACVAVPAEMVVIAGGVGHLGCNEAVDTACEADEKPQVHVALPTFLIDRFEVSVAAYATCVGKGDCAASTGSDAACNHGYPKRQSHPANCVDYAQAAAYCQHVGKRLPTEAEWARAARGGCGAGEASCAKAPPRYPWGLDAANCKITVMFGDTKAGCDLGTTRSVGAFAKDQSASGVRDLGGNVCEWVSDGYSATAYADYAKQPAPVQAPETPAAGSARLCRGGSLDDVPKGVRAGDRHPIGAATVAPAVGFRCAKDVGN